MIGRPARPWVLQGDDRIDIPRDAHGVPHVRVTTEADLYRGLGYCHGRDRGLQILITRVLASGRASELLESSDEMLAFDRFFRRINFAAAIDAEVAKLAPADRALGDAYCDGLNQAFARRTPWELKLVGYRPAPWSLRNSIVISRAMGYVQTAQHQGDIERLLVEMVQAGVPAAHLEDLFPGLLDGLDHSLVSQVRLGERLVPDSVRWGVGIPRAIASNNWVLSAAKTASGQAILASDPHLEANRLPAVWYESVLELGDRFCVNATIPGLPFCAIARTNDLAWAPTYAPIDAVDSWIEDCRDGCYRRVENGSEAWEPFRERTEVIKRKSKPDEAVTFYENDHGVLDGDPFEPGLYLTTGWSAGASTGATSLKSAFGMFFAADVDSGMAHLGAIESSWNWVLADRHANIAYQMSGRMPLRAPGWSGLTPLPGWDPENDWKGVAPASDLPRARNPEAGFIATANNDLNHLGERAPVNLPMGSHRAERIAELLASRDDWTSELAQQMQMDVYSRQAAQFLPVLRPLLPAGPQAKALAEWDLRYDPGSRAATLFERFYRELVFEVLRQRVRRRCPALPGRRDRDPRGLLRHIRSRAARSRKPLVRRGRTRRDVRAHREHGARRARRTMGRASAVHDEAPDVRRQAAQLAGVQPRSDHVARRTSDDPPRPDLSRGRARDQLGALLPVHHRPRRPLAAGARAGLLATAAMDVGAHLLAPTLRAQPLHPALLGRWVGHLRDGTTRHHDITTATEVKGEAMIGAITHYTIGAVLGSGYTLMLRIPTPRPATLPSAIVYGASTTAFAWFAMFPSMGFGVMAQAARQRRLLGLSGLNHGVFGLALGLSIRRLG